MAILAALYPPEHPYHWLTIGAADDLRAAKLDDVKTFFQTYYRPRNASIAVAGHVDVTTAFTLVSDYFGEIEAGNEPPDVDYAPPPRRMSETRLRLEERVGPPRLYIAWHPPAPF